MGECFFCISFVLLLDGWIERVLGFPLCGICLGRLARSIRLLVLLASVLLVLPRLVLVWTEGFFGGGSSCATSDARLLESLLRFNLVLADKGEPDRLAVCRKAMVEPVLTKDGKTTNKDPTRIHLPCTYRYVLDSG